MSNRRKRGIEDLANQLRGRDVRAIVRGGLDRRTWWVLFGPGDGGGYRVDNYVWADGRWEPAGDSIDAGSEDSHGWDMLGCLFVRAFTEP